MDQRLDYLRALGTASLGFFGILDFPPESFDVSDPGGGKHVANRFPSVALLFLEFLDPCLASCDLLVFRLRVLSRLPGFLESALEFDRDLVGILV